jgi:hypothetical protein
MLRFVSIRSRAVDCLLGTAGRKTLPRQHSILSAGLVVACLFGTATLASAATINVDLEGYRTAGGTSLSLVPPTTYVGTGAAGGGNVFNGISPTALSDNTASATTGDNQTLSSVGGLLDSNGLGTPVRFSVGPVGVDNENANSGSATNATSLFDDYLFNNSGANASNATFTISGLAPGSAYSLYLYAGFADTGHFPNVSVSGGTATPFSATGIFSSSNTELFTGVADGSGDITGTLGAGVNILAGFSLVGTEVPEPGSIVALVGLCGMGLVGVAIRRRRGA